jgi:hypothetical protein
MRLYKLCLFLLACLPSNLLAQSSFEELVEKTYGSDQTLVNGIQFSNQYIRIEGNPYFMDGRYQFGAVCINDRWYDPVRMRYNLYTQKVEIEYLTPEDHMNQLITVPEQMPEFILGGYLFRRMSLGNDDGAYYMVLSTEETESFIGWTLDAVGGGNTRRRFTPLERKCWIRHDGNWILFDDRRSYLGAFPAARRKEFKDLLKWKKFHFRLAGTNEWVDLVRTTMRLIEEGGYP